MASLDLTDKARVKLLLDPGGTFGSTWDTLLDQIIDEVSDTIERRCGRQFLRAARTEYHDGTGTDTLLLGQGPLVSIASVEQVAYSDSGGGTRAETLTAVLQAQRLEIGLASEGATGRAGVRMISGTFIEGRRNYKVVYTAGFGTTLADLITNGYLGIVEVASRHVAATFLTREAVGLISKDLGDGSISPVPQSNLDAALIRALEPWRLR